MDQPLYPVADWVTGVHLKHPIVFMWFKYYENPPNDEVAETQKLFLNEEQLQQLINALQSRLDTLRNFEYPEDGNS